MGYYMRYALKICAQDKNKNKKGSAIPPLSSRILVVGHRAHGIRNALWMSEFAHNKLEMGGKYFLLAVCASASSAAGATWPRWV